MSITFEDASGEQIKPGDIPKKIAKGESIQINKQRRVIGEISPKNAVFSLCKRCKFQVGRLLRRNEKSFVECALCGAGVFMAKEDIRMIYNPKTRHLKKDKAESKPSIYLVKKCVSTVFFMQNASSRESWRL